MRPRPTKRTANLAIALPLMAGLLSSPVMAPCAMAQELAPQPQPSCSCCCCDPAPTAAPGGQAGAPMQGCGDEAPCGIGPAPSPDHVFLPTTANLPGSWGDPSSAAPAPQVPMVSVPSPLRGLPLFEPSPRDTPRYLTLSVLRI